MTTTIILVGAAVILFVAGLFTGNDETAIVLKLMSVGMALAAIISGFFRSNVGYKPTREEMEERVFGKKD